MAKLIHHLFVFFESGQINLSGKVKLLAFKKYFLKIYYRSFAVNHVSGRKMLALCF